MSDEYIPKLNFGPYFKAREFRCSHCGELPPFSTEYQDFLSDLHVLRSTINHPFIVNSGWRCPEHEVEKKKATPGAHFFPGAVDISVRDGDFAALVVREALSRGWLGIGVNQSGPRKDRYIHLDMKDRGAGGKPGNPVMWSY